ncbi:MAG: DNA polymerase III subunit delta [Bdellovibrionales bacterium]|nr:DNA polymerase III subunit delta [Bdellovibrionales bacterium]
MPKLEPKLIQKELEKGKVRPVYFLFGTERMKARELIRKIQRASLLGASVNDFNLEKFDASDTGIERILDSAQSGSMTGGTKFVLVRNAEDLRNLDPLAEYLKSLPTCEPSGAESFSTVLVLASKTFDGRKKASKVLSDLAAVVPCEEVKEQEREAWIEFLAKRRGLSLADAERLSLRGLDPWSLDIVDQELSKLELVGEDAFLRAEALRSGVSAYAQDEFIDAIFMRDKKRALGVVHHFSKDLEVQLPFLGLLAWNLRQFKLFLLEQETRTPSLERRNPMLQQKLERWRKSWNRRTVQDLERGLFEIDFSLKNTRLSSSGLWTGLIFGLDQ